MINIELSRIDDIFKKVFGDKNLSSIDITYEHIDNNDEELKLVIIMKKLYSLEDSPIIYSKFIFVCNSEKTNITRDSFLYLYDINCKYKMVFFDDEFDLEKKLKNIVEKKIFGKNIIILSDFIKHPSFSINEWLKENKVDDISVINVVYDPKVSILPCKSLFFSFQIELSNQQKIVFNLTKEGKNEYRFDFKINNEHVMIMRNNLNYMISTIGEIIKNKIK